MPVSRAVRGGRDAARSCPAEMPHAHRCATVMRVPSYLLRIELLDRPGSLGSLAVALGSVDADILSLDVVERGCGYAIDDLVVELAPGAMPDALITAAESLNGVRVDSVRPHTGLLEAHRELELLDHVATARDNTSRLQVLANEAPRVLRVSWCTVLRSVEGELQRLAGSPGARRRVPLRHRGFRSSKPNRWTEAPSGCQRSGAIWTPGWWPRRWATSTLRWCWGGPARNFGPRRWLGWAIWPGSWPPCCASAARLVRFFGNHRVVVFP